MNIKKFIKNLQDQPYEKRVKIMWLSSIIAAVVVGVIWLSLIALQAKIINEPKIESGVLSALEKDFETAKEKFEKLDEEIKQQVSSLNITQENDFLALTKFTKSFDNTKLVIEFTISNPSLDILYFLEPNSANLKLTADSMEYEPELILTRPQEDPFPSKVLGGQNLDGYLVFDAPQAPEATLQVTNMYFESLPFEKFSETKQINLDASTSGTKTDRLPRQ